MTDFIQFLIKFWTSIMPYAVVWSLTEVIATMTLRAVTGKSIFKRGDI